MHLQKSLSIDFFSFRLFACCFLWSLFTYLYMAVTNTLTLESYKLVLHASSFVCCYSCRFVSPFNSLDIFFSSVVPFIDFFACLHFLIFILHFKQFIYRFHHPITLNSVFHQKNIHLIAGEVHQNPLRRRRKKAE